MTKISQVIKENEEEFKRVRTDAISEMFNNPDEFGIYPTTKFFNAIDDNFHTSQLRLISAFKEMVEELNDEENDCYSPQTKKGFNLAKQNLLSSLTEEK
jgi:hypothetical protein